MSFKSTDVSRRDFLRRVVVGTQLPFAAGCRAQAQPAAGRLGRVPTPASGKGPKALLQPSDFTYLGYYDIQTNGANSPYAQGLTHRYVDGDLRLLSLQNNGQLDEISLAGRVFGELIATPIRSWQGIGGMRDYKGFWWEEAKQRLWSVTATSVTTTIVPTQIYTRTLNDDGSVNNVRGPISLEGIAAKRVFGGIQPVPDWFQQQHGVGPYIVGWGGGTSLIMAGGNASIGPTMYAMPDPDAYGNGTSISSRVFKTIMDCSPATQHRGVRATHPLNYLDGGDPRPNSPTPPSGPPVASGRWLSPRSDGKGWWTPCDSYWNTGQWIDTPTKHAFIAILSGFGGKAYYMASDVHCDYMQLELHVFDPERLGQAAQGRVAPYAIEPTHMIELELPGLSRQGRKTHMTPGQGVGGATYDAREKKLYLLGLGINNFSATNRLYVYQVNV
jgi:hypothetical protein